MVGTLGADVGCAARRGVGGVVGGGSGSGPGQPPGGSDVAGGGGVRAPFGRLVGARVGSQSGAARSPASTGAVQRGRPSCGTTGSTRGSRPSSPNAPRRMRSWYGAAPCRPGCEPPCAGRSWTGTRASPACTATSCPGSAPATPDRRGAGGGRRSRTPRGASPGSRSRAHRSTRGRRTRAAGPRPSGAGRTGPRTRRRARGYRGAGAVAGS